MNNDIFQVASRKAFRFTSNKGDLTTEQLWTLPLSAVSGTDLNNVAIVTNNALKALTEESFVNTRPTPGKADLETKLEVVKHIIAVKQAENAAKLEAADKAAKREKLINALANQEDKELANLSPEQIRERLKELD